ncbi:hypothetical protein ACJQWK_07167 [Exserohilum turcicum]|uniref:Kinetochore protein mis14 n=1 Tax=Exserohilum turcicum (strain 28A) TaxID=671987 RepID=R0KAD6_EXST2|nr:uncharacterized protein SETTUDRAFT_179696 [Exserohilum turcica Et28A]EOA85162.1 hypothetical protein SETTUDRAFT_179696 [Exserohilum turcica Et28A]
MESEHRKIELQSPSDLAFVTSQIRAAARQKLDLHLPPVSDASEPDELRRNVEDLVDAFVAQVLHGMRQNISINGLDVVSTSSTSSSSQNGGGVGVEMHDGTGTGTGTAEGESLVETEEFEPFDEKTRVQLAKAIAKRDALIAKISKHRRATPAAAAEAWKDRFEKENQDMASLLLQHDASIGSHAVPGVQNIPRQDDVARNWERAVDGLQRLNKGLPETRARLERARHVVGYLEGE